MSRADIRVIADELIVIGGEAPTMTPDEQSILDSMALRCIHCQEWHPTEVVARLSKC